MSIWEDLTTIDVRALDPANAVAILPVAAVEQHGPHLPLGTDAIIGDAILDAALARLEPALPIFRLPGQRIGHSPEHEAFPGTLSLRAETLIALWTDIGRSVAAAGVRKLVLFNSHGGQGALVDVVAQRLRSEAAMLVVRCSYYRFALPEDTTPEPAITERERRFGLHGGQIETSLMLHIAPHLVRRDRCADVRSRAEAWQAAEPDLEVEGETGIAWCAQDLDPSGVIGDATAASADLGVRLLAYYAQRLARVIAAFQRTSFLPPS